jgi:hypothetical protein
MAPKNKKTQIKSQKNANIMDKYWNIYIPETKIPRLIQFSICKAERS